MSLLESIPYPFFFPPWTRCIYPSWGLFFIHATNSLHQLTQLRVGSVAAIFPTIGHEILRLRLLNREQREEAELAAMLNPKAQTGAAIRNRRGIWKTITSPFSRRRSTMPS